MTDNEVYNILATQLEAAIAKAGWSVVVMQSFQPTQEGIPSGPSVALTKLFDHEYGWPMQSMALNAVTPPGYLLPDFSQYGDQWVESTFQVTSLAIQDPSDLLRPTASDIANQLKMYINALPTIWAMRDSGVSIIRVTDIRNPQFTDDRDRFESSPNFDVICQYKRQIVFSIPGSNEVVGDVYGVEEGV